MYYAGKPSVAYLTKVANRKIKPRLKGRSLDDLIKLIDKTHDPLKKKQQSP